MIIEGGYFIDRNPKYFGYVLDYLRNLRIPIDSDIPLKALKYEADYFNLQHLKQELNKRIDPQKQTDTAKIQSDWSDESHMPSKAQITRAALLASEGHLTSVEWMVIQDISITDIPQAQMEELTSIATRGVVIQLINHADQLGSVLACIKCPYLWLGNMELSEAETRALVTAMRDRVKTVELVSDVTLDIEELAKYNGQGHCGWLCVEDDTKTRYAERLREWAADQGWTVTERDNSLMMERNSQTGEQ